MECVVAERGLVASSSGEHALPDFRSYKRIARSGQSAVANAVAKEGVVLAVGGKVYRRIAANIERRASGNKNVTHTGAVEHVLFDAPSLGQLDDALCVERSHDSQASEVVCGSRGLQSCGKPNRCRGGVGGCTKVGGGGKREGGATTARGPCGAAGVCGQAEDVCGDAAG